MKYLKALFGEEALTYDQFVEKLAEAGDGIKLANLAEGGYVSRAKYDDDVADAKGKLDAANGTITDLQGKLSQFDGVDVDDLNGRLQTLQQKYDHDVGELKLESAIATRVRDFGARNPKLVAGAVDRSKISLSDDGMLTGVDEQLEQLKQSDEYLFHTEEKKTVGTGHHGGKATPSATEKDPEKMSMSEYRKYRKQQ